MRMEELEPDVLVFRGDAYQSVATAFVHGREVLLVDALASRADAGWMRRELEEVLGKGVRVIVVTHYMSDHVAGLALFPGARIVAHRYCEHTFFGQRGRSPEDDASFVPPTEVVDEGMTLEWGRRRLSILHNPGKTLCALAVDVPSLDLVLTGDAVVGNTAYLSSSVPALVRGAIERLERLGRSRIVPGHIGVFPSSALGNARRYLDALGARVAAARREGRVESLRTVRIEECLAPGVVPTEFEREWHGRNLKVVLERRLFAADWGLP